MSQDGFENEGILNIVCSQCIKVKSNLNSGYITLVFNQLTGKFDLGITNAILQRRRV